ncbi:MAG: SapC family protein [Pseudomonadota bacterium]
MATQLLFYENAVPVSSKKHAKLCVKAGESYAFASKINSVPLTASEFAEAAAEYPIVFAGEGENVVPTVILGVAGSQNAYVSEKGGWGGRYIPAFIRRYPFVFSQETSDNQLILHIDESFEGCNTDGRGEHLFDSEGNQTQYLKNVLAFLQDYQARFTRSQSYCKRLVELDLLRPMQAQFTMPGGEKRSLTGFMTVDRDRLKALDGDMLKEMMSTDELECTFLHLNSLRHFGDVADRTASDAADAAATPKEEEKAAKASFKSKAKAKET